MPMPFSPEPPHCDRTLISDHRQTLFDTLGLLYLEMIDCHGICVGFTILCDMIISF